jgi:hypothetical protein
MDAMNVTPVVRLGGSMDETFPDEHGAGISASGPAHFN